MRHGTEPCAHAVGAQVHAGPTTATGGALEDGTLFAHSFAHEGPYCVPCKHSQHHNLWSQTCAVNLPCARRSERATVRVMQADDTLTVES